MFLQLIAANIIGTEVVVSKLMWCVARQEVKGRYPTHSWKLDSSWLGVWLHKDTDKKRYNVK